MKKEKKNIVYLKSYFSVFSFSLVILIFLWNVQLGLYLSFLFHAATEETTAASGEETTAVSSGKTTNNMEKKKLLIANREFSVIKFLISFRSCLL